MGLVLPFIVFWRFHLLFQTFFSFCRGIGGRQAWDYRLRGMAYIEDGTVKAKRSMWRLSFIVELFWAVVNLIASFIRTMFSMEATESYKKKSGSRGGGWDSGPGGGGGSGGGPYGSGPRRPPRGLDNVRGIDPADLRASRAPAVAPQVVDRAGDLHHAPLSLSKANCMPRRPSLPYLFHINVLFV